MKRFFLKNFLGMGLCLGVGVFMGNSVKWIPTALSQGEQEEIDPYSWLEIDRRLSELEDSDKDRRLHELDTDRRLHELENALKNSSPLDKMKFIYPPCDRASQALTNTKITNTIAPPITTTVDINANQDPEGTVYLVQAEYFKWWISQHRNLRQDGAFPLFILEKGSTIHHSLNTAGVRIQLALASDSLEAKFFDRAHMNEQTSGGLQACLRTIIKIKP